MPYANVEKRREVQRKSQMKRRKHNLSTPEMSTPKMSTPEISTPEMSTPEMSTPKMSTPKSVINFELMYDYNELSNYLSLMRFNCFQLWMIKQRQVCADLKTKYGFKLWLVRFRIVMKELERLSQYPKWRYEIKECLTELKQHISNKNIRRKVNNYKHMCLGLFI